NDFGRSEVWESSHGIWRGTNVRRWQKERIAFLHSLNSRPLARHENVRHICLLDKFQRRDRAADAARHNLKTRSADKNDIRAAIKGDVGDVYCAGNDGDVLPAGQEHGCNYRRPKIGEAAEMIATRANVVCCIRPDADADIRLPRALRRERRPSDVVFTAPP